MGIPQQYSVELPRRCLALIDALLPHARGVRLAGEEDAGPLVTTFILAMSTPMITLPIERVERHRGKQVEGYVDERHLNAGVEEAVNAALGGAPLSHSPFFHGTAWRYAVVPYTEGMNFARELLYEVIEQLSTDAALEDARQMNASAWASCLRNALAHGGILYLDENGRQSHGAPTEHIAFVSSKRAGWGGPVTALQVLRISRDGYLDFLSRWAGWLEASGLSLALAA